LKLSGKTAVITGGALGIGKQTAILFIKEGANVVIADFDEVAGHETVKELTEAGGEALFVKTDVTNVNQVTAMVQTTLQKFNRIDILINNAGITADAFLTKMTEEQWDRVINVNLKGVFNCTKAVIPIMVQQGDGRILNASSVVGLYGNMGQTNYAASKAGVIGMTKSLAKELGPKGIRVNAVAPGFIVTEMTSKVPQKVLDLMEGKTPLKRLGQPEDIAKAYLFLSSPDSDFINGVVLSVDGGLSL
jgi:3-oxoacyl-[acyl-carrier protein] reductase